MTQTTTSAVRFDPALPQTRVMLDPQAVAFVLGRSLNQHVSEGIRIRYLRYKPGTNLVVHYEVGVNGRHFDAVGMVASRAKLARHASKPENLQLARTAASRAPSATPLVYHDDVGCLIQWYPLDLSLPALATPPGELRRQLRGAGILVEPSNGDPNRLAYKPRRRAVLRIANHVLKVYAREKEFSRALNGLRAASTLRGFVAPRLEAVLSDQRVTVQTLLRGRTVSAASDLATDAGVLLALLHSSDVGGLRVFDPVAQLDSAGSSARLVGAIAPELRPQLRRLLNELENSRPEGMGLVPSHGDFNARQLLVMNGNLAATDFDPFCLAPAALDPATYAAYLVRGGSDDLNVALAALTDLVGGYGSRPAALSWYLATMILRRAPRPFRYFEPDWRPRLDEMVNSAERALWT